MNVYSLHRVIDGKWEVLLKIREGDDFRHDYVSRPDIKPIIENHYNSPPEELARVILETVMDCKSVKVSLLCGPAVLIEREEA